MKRKTRDTEQTKNETAVFMKSNTCLVRRCLFQFDFSQYGWFDGCFWSMRDVLPKKGKCSEHMNLVHVQYQYRRCPNERRRLIVSEQPAHLLSSCLHNVWSRLFIIRTHNIFVLHFAFVVILSSSGNYDIPTNFRLYRIIYYSTGTIILPNLSLIFLQLSNSRCMHVNRT